MKTGAPLNVRAEIAKRLKQELARKDLSVDGIARQTDLPTGVIVAYLKAEREIRFAELGPICSALQMRLMRLLAPRFSTPRLQYRSAGGRNRELAARVENIFLIVADLLPKPRRLTAKSVDDRDGDVGMLLAEVRSAADDLHRQYPTTEALLDAAQLPILPISAGDDAFDAFLMSIGDKAVICVNQNKPTARIHFSLLHEVAHYCWHGDRDIPVDVLDFSVYRDEISEAVRPEYVANKFAQLSLVPWEDAERYARQWRSLPDITDYLAERRTTPEVLASGVYDQLRFRPNPPSFVDVRDAFKTATRTYSCADLREFVEDRGRALRDLVKERRDQFSDDIWNEIMSAWGV